MTEWISQESWLAWGVGLLLGFPLFMVLLGETMSKSDRSQSGLRGFLGLGQYLLLPSLVLYLLLGKVLSFGVDNLLYKISATLFWVSLLLVILSAVNLFWLRRDSTGTWQTRIPPLVLNIGRLFMVLVGIAFILSLIWGIDLGKLLAALGVGSIVLGLALQDTLSGLFAGITLISARQFQEGDWLQTGDTVGRVTSVSWHSVSLRTFENDLLVIPNSILAKQSFKNYSRPEGVHMERIQLQFNEEHPPNAVISVLQGAAEKTPGVLTSPPPRIILRELGDDAGTYEALLFFDDYADIDQVRSGYLICAWYAAKRADLAFPIEDLLIYGLGKKDIRISPEDSMSPAELCTFLLEQEVFHLPESELKILSEIATIQRFGKGERVIQAEEEVDAIYVVLEGGARQILSDRQGKDHQWSAPSPGEIFGLTSVLRHSPSQTTVLATEDLLVAKIPFRFLKETLQANPAFTRELEQDVDVRLASLLALRARKSSQAHGPDIADNSTSDLKELLARRKP